MRILLVDDSASDAEMMRDALEESGWDAHVDVAWDGVEAMQSLRTARPDLVLLDLNMPRKTGHEVLRELRADPGLSDVPVVVLTTSHADGDILAAFEEHADGYVTKPEDYDDVAEVVRSIRRFWDKWGAA